MLREDKWPAQFHTCRVTVFYAKVRTKPLSLTEGDFHWLLLFKIRQYITKTHWPINTGNRFLRCCLCDKRTTYAYKRCNTSLHIECLKIGLGFFGISMSLVKTSYSSYTMESRKQDKSRTKNVQGWKGQQTWNIKELLRRSSIAN